MSDRDRIIGLVQRIITCDASRLRDRSLICVHLLNPLTLGLALKELSVTHFDDVISTVRILIDMVEQLRYETDEYQQGLSCNLGYISCLLDGSGVYLISPIGFSRGNAGDGTHILK